MVEQNAKLQQREAAPKRAEKTRRAAPKCATEKKFRLSSRTKSIDVILRTTHSKKSSRIDKLSPRGFVM